MKIFFGKSSKTERTIVPEVLDDREEISRLAPKKREVVIDIVRGFAVLVMVITHVVAITYSGGAGTSPAVYYLGLFGGIFSFTAFLFISGISTYFANFRHNLNLSPEAENIQRKKKIGRLIKLLFSYYILASVSIFVNTSLYSFPPSFSWVQNIISTLLFSIVPAFSEFLIPLFLISLTVLLIPKFYKYLINNPLFGLFFMSVVYAIGTLISQIDLKSDNLNTLKALLGGQLFSAGSLHTFPLFQYFPVFLLGLYLGHYFYHHPDIRKRIKLNFLWLIIFIVLTVAGTLSYYYLRTNLLFPLPDEGRFPPSLTFLTLSVSLILGVLLLFQIFAKLIPKFIKGILNYFGVNAIETLLFHTILLFAYEYFTKTIVNPNGIKHVSLTDVIIIYIVVLFLSSILIGVKNYLKKWSLKENDEEKVWWFFTERAISTLVLVLIFAFVGTSLYKEVFVKSASANVNSFVFKKRLIREEDPWWNHDYSTYRTMNIQNVDSALPIFAGSWVSLTFNHEDALGHGASKSHDGNDLRIVYLDSINGNYLEIPFYLEGAATSTAKLSFKLLDNINPGDTAQNYYLYYGNENVPKASEPQDKYSIPPIDKGITLGEENTHDVFGHINRKWFLIGNQNSNTELSFEADILSDKISASSVVNYSVIGTNKSGKMKVIEGKKYQATFKVNDLEPGTYTINAAVTDTSNKLRVSHSQNIKFYVSYPLYVSWTFDWEGWDVSQDNLNAIANIEDSYKITSTHFFNPRIYVKEQSDQNKTIATISPERAQYLTSWIKLRAQNNGDEIGMHMHMWQDMVKEAGVTAKSSPVISGTYGSDVPTYSYSQGELEKIFNWGKDKFYENGLGVPISYRTGAWMSGENVLQAAENTGFKIDSSGRTGGKVNVNYSSSSQVPWSLNDTTYPYLPNKDDINKWDASLSNRLDIWEFPNNGADSYWFTKEELIKRFDNNFSDKQTALTRPQNLVYLTHPHWFTTVDEWKIRALFDYINNFRYSSDKGPVVFDSLENVFGQWDTAKFYNGN